MATMLSDLDELVLSVRDLNTRKYAQEAILAHRNGLNRSALVSLWIAVAYDVISKIRELATQGDKRAQQDIAALDAAITNKELKKLQAFEADLLRKAEKDYEFFGARDGAELERLKKDRDACAHPGFVQTAILFDPTPELVRAHTVTAIQSLLSIPPVQGKAALAQILQDVIQPSFPSDAAQVETFLNQRYLDHAKSGLVDSIAVVFLKAVVRQVEPSLVGHERNVVEALRAVAVKHPLSFEAICRRQLPGILRATNDQCLRRVFRVLGKVPQLWDWLDRTDQIRLEVLLKAIGTPIPPATTFAASSEDLGAIVWGIEVPSLQPLAIAAFERIADGEKLQIIQHAPRLEFASEAIRLFGEATSFRDAEDLGKRSLLPIAPYLDAARVGDALDAAKNNGQIWDSGEMPEIMSQFFDLTENLGDALRGSWEGFTAFIDSKGYVKGNHYYYEAVRDRMQAKGWTSGTAPSATGGTGGTPAVGGTP